MTQSRYAGKRLIIIEKTNPRRKGSHGAKHYRLYKHGSTYESLSSQKGFGHHHLSWDLKHGYVRFR
jgi:hypothetical protein